MDVTLIGWTAFAAPKGVPWETDAVGGPALVEFAGRACYQSWSKPNPRTATNESYLKHLIDVQHFSVLEHGQATFYFEGVSRSLTHELIRHRHFSYSQLSQRYVPENEAEFIEPKIIRGYPDLHPVFSKASTAVREAYNDLLAGLDEKLKNEKNTTKRKKLARQAARAILPNATETKIVVTGNYRAWREFIVKRNSPDADVEIQELASLVLDRLYDHAPSIFKDMINGN